MIFENLKFQKIYIMQDRFYTGLYFCFEYSCTNKWISIVIYLVKQSKLDPKINSFKVLHTAIL